jgi:hypothetical protein
MNVTTATRSRRDSMSENVSESENTGKPAPDVAKPRGARKPPKKAKQGKREGRAKKPGFEGVIDPANRSTGPTQLPSLPRGARCSMG